MKAIPVIDILNGVVVHAVRGKRNEYKPLQSNLSSSVDPVEVAKVFKKFGFSELYVADLDAIIDCSADFQVFQRITDVTGLNLMVDAGVTSMERAEKLLESGVSKLVIGTETLKNKSFVGEAVKAFGSDRVIVSLDLKGDKVLVKLGFNGCTDPICLLSEFKAMGVSQVIVLDLARVGSGEGVNMDFMKKVLAEVQLNLYVGGGVRDISDLLELRDTGISGALVATSLHSGKISIEQLKDNGFL
ncbi:MAG TPA: HisA/HisF-related TIM barrel protein [Candidatus Acidoferrales bacterium]|nr:HisA/HisF-related TIM barrel protein [Candidatus Acidoferrales bacterium]